MRALNEVNDFNDFKYYYNGKFKDGEKNGKGKLYYLREVMLLY